MFGTVFRSDFDVVIFDCCAIGKANQALLIALGCQVIEGNGSRVRFEKSGLIATFHRPHPAKEAKPYQVRDARQFIESLGVKP